MGCCAAKESEEVGVGGVTLQTSLPAEERLREDEARAAEAAAQPLPEGSTWHKWGGAELEPHLACTTVIDAKWLLKLATGEAMPEREGVVPPWQQLPPEAKLSLTTLRRSNMKPQMPVAALTSWVTAVHSA